MINRAWISISMGIIILIADIVWLVTPTGQFASYTFSSSSAPWLEMGIVILLATSIWLGVDFSYMMQRTKKRETAQKSDSEESRVPKT